MKLPQGVALRARRGSRAQVEAPNLPRGDVTAEIDIEVLITHRADLIVKSQVASRWPCWRRHFPACPSFPAGVTYIKKSGPHEK